jgi:hypothetical protein
VTLTVDLQRDQLALVAERPAPSTGTQDRGVTVDRHDVLESVERHHALDPLGADLGSLLIVDRLRFGHVLDLQGQGGEPGIESGGLSHHYLTVGSLVWPHFYVVT